MGLGKTPLDNKPVPFPTSVAKQFLSSVFHSRLSRKGRGTPKSLCLSDEAACRAQPPSGPVIVLTEQSCHTYNLEKCDLGKETRWGLQLAIVTLLPKDKSKGLAEACE